MSSIEDVFRKYFSNLEIQLPHDSFEKMEGGTLRKRSTHVTYAFGSDDKGRYVSAYASNRFVWGATHIRIYEDGEVIELPGLRDFTMHRSNETSEERNKIEEDYERHNKMVFEMLEKEGIKQIWDSELLKMCEKFKKLD